MHAEITAVLRDGGLHVFAGRGVGVAGVEDVVEADGKFEAGGEFAGVEVEVDEPVVADGAALGVADVRGVLHFGTGENFVAVEWDEAAEFGQSRRGTGAGGAGDGVFGALFGVADAGECAAVVAGFEFQFSPVADGVVQVVEGEQAVTGVDDLADEFVHFVIKTGRAEAQPFGELLFDDAFVGGDFFGVEVALGGVAHL